MISIRVFRYVIFLIGLILTDSIHAQLLGTTVGDASVLGNNCFEITPPLQNQSGGVWYDSAIDLNEDFVISYQSNFGNFDVNGADGITWVIKNDPFPLVGDSGAGIGYGGISESLAVEFDTFENLINSDPIDDHVAITRDGITDHGANTNLAGPVNASSTSSNIEDGLDHNIRIEWLANTVTLNVYFDCVLRLSYTGDIVNDIFSGNEIVYFGFVASTGVFFNSNQICFNNVSFVDDLILTDTTICSGESVNVDATVNNGVTYSWSPVTGVSDPNIANPVLSPIVTTTYVITTTDSCGIPFDEDITITVNDPPSTVTLTDTTICPGETVNVDATTANATGYSWTPVTGVSDPNIADPTITPTVTTTYTVTVTGDCGVITEDITITVDDVLGTVTLTDTTICPGETVNVDATTANATGYSWTPVTGVSDPNIADPTITPTVTTTYTVTVTGDCGVITEDITITVDDALGTVMLTDTTICLGETVNVDATTANATGYSWTPVTGVSDPNIADPTITPTVTTTYTVTITGDCGIILEDIIIEVTPRLVPDFDNIGPICLGDILQDLPNTDLNGISGSWSPVINDLVTTTYTFTPDDQNCTDLFFMTIEVVPPPVVDLGDQIIFCVTQDEMFSEVINTGLPGALYDFEWFFNGVLLTGEAGSSLIINQEGIYEVLVTDTMTNCTGRDTIEVVFQLDITSFLINQLSSDFSNNHSIEVIVEGEGDFEYQLNDGPWQDQNIFANIEGCGEYIVSVRGNDLCNELSDSVFLLNYPLFFTPNNDGINDFWNIDCVADQSEALLFIFDRYGKLISSFKPSEDSWDGKYLGRPMPATDYWFVLEYIDMKTDQMKRFRNHFTLKR